MKTPLPSQPPSMKRLRGQSDASMPLSKWPAMANATEEPQPGPSRDITCPLCNAMHDGPGSLRAHVPTVPEVSSLPCELIGNILRSPVTKTSQHKYFTLEPGSLTKKELHEAAKALNVRKKNIVAEYIWRSMERAVDLLEMMELDYWKGLRAFNFYLGTSIVVALRAHLHTHGKLRFRGAHWIDPWDIKCRGEMSTPARAPSLERPPGQGQTKRARRRREKAALEEAAIHMEDPVTATPSAPVIPVAAIHMEDPAPASPSAPIIPDPLHVITPNMEFVVNQAWNNNHQVIANKNGVHVSSEDLQTLRGTTWLNDNIVDAYLQLIAERSEENEKIRVYAYPSIYMTKLLDQGYEAAKPKRRRVDIFSYDILLFPVHSSAHWTLAIVDNRHHSIVYYDSLGGFHHRCVDVLRDFIEGEHLALKGTAPEYYQGYRKDKIPRQGNGHDCGVFVCQFAEYSSRDAYPTFSQQDMEYFRKRMAWELIQDTLLNEGN